MKVASLFLLLTLFSFNTAAQQKKGLVKANNQALQNVPANNRRALIERLNLHILYLQSNNVAGLFDLATERKRAGLSRAEFLKAVRITTEGEILKLKIRRVTMARADQYIDEPPPAPDQGNKWFVSACAKVRDGDKTVKKVEMGFDVWLTRGQWYIDRGGRRLDNGYVRCNF